ncbi:Tectonic-1 [Liparis tanakae]|uniref:Tectonic-1 n=1 Tax=Liparis tanakae TaxID=230148 RepID=A0A4Z2FT75_9TELE|nr:Tectonic-1 [Liparis tanakae]
MAVSAPVFLTTSNLFCLFLLSTAVTAHGNTTSYNLNTVYGDQNVTYNVTDDYTTTQPTEFDSTTPTTSNYSSTDEPVQPTTPAEPLPVTRRLLPPVTEVGSVCPCDIDTDVCDINCCCDRTCSEEVALFTGCSVDYNYLLEIIMGIAEVRNYKIAVGKKQLCSIDVATYLLGRTVDGFSELKSSVRNKTNYDVFCIQSQNRVDGLSHPSPALPTESNFDSLFKEFTSFIFGSEENGGLCGDVMVTAGESGQRGMFWLPGPCITADCMDTSPAVFLKDQSSWCSRHVVLQQDCVSLPALRMDTYTDIRLFAVASVVLQSVDGTQTALKINGGEHLNPVLLNSTFCANVVLKVAYVTKYNPAGEIVNVTVSLVLGFVRKAALRLEQEFHITFVQENGEETAVHYSGNPGYVVGLPLVSGTRTAEYPLPAWTLDFPPLDLPTV